MDDKTSESLTRSTSSEAEVLEDAILTNDTKSLKELLKHIDINLPLNDRHETALILAVKLSSLSMVQILLKDAGCDKNYVNINSCSALDLALVTGFDNRLEPRHSVCWQIVEILLENNAEPMCKDAMMYIIRTALKYQDDDFIFRVIDTCSAKAQSLRFHELLLLKLHRHQPMCASIIDPFLQRVSEYTIKLIKIINSEELYAIINSFEYYMDSHWACRETKAVVFRKLVLYATGAGWHFSKTDIKTIKRICCETAEWCNRQYSSPPSLMHLCRVSVRRSASCKITKALDNNLLPLSIRNYILLSDVDCLFSPDSEKMSLKLFSF